MEDLGSYALRQVFDRRLGVDDDCEFLTWVTGEIRRHVDGQAEE